MKIGIVADYEAFNLREKIKTYLKLEDDEGKEMDTYLDLVVPLVKT